ncbi:MAG: glycosyltransferase family 4 protein, partial [Anaerolineales bacterium]|nr:glycosyltransferase family 4 protein [Anaerolineales bacterium]
MNITAFAINPLYPDQVIGGSTKHLHNVAVHLGELGHKITIFSTRREDTAVAFRWHENVEIRPELTFKQPFPQPYETAPHNIAWNIQRVAEHLATADRFYMHDGELLFPPLYADKPAIVSLRDNVYPETLLGSFLFRGDALIAIADYSRQVYLHTAGQFFPQLAERTITINNGIDFDKFFPAPPSPAIFDYVDVDPTAHDILLHPHRPEPSKGLPQTIEVVDRLVREHGRVNLRVLVPQWFASNLNLEVRAFAEQIEQEIAQRGLREHFIFHGWVPQSLMPDYYRLGDVTLALGHFVEAFGNVPYESLACGTPAVVARVATHRSLLPDDLIAKVHFNDHDTAAQITADLLRHKQRTSPATMSYLKAHYGIETQLAAYAEVILNTPKQSPLAYRLHPLDETTR